MALYALEDIDDAVSATRSLLWPVDRTLWIKLAVVVFFVGGPGASFNSVQYNVPANGDTPPGDVPLPPEIGANILLVVGSLVLIGLLIGLLFLLVGSVMEFVLVESLRRETVTIRQYWGSAGGRGFGCSPSDSSSGSSSSAVRWSSLP
ncbi:hypothetical protein ACFQL1_02895 [Halomicroarcula sp. GCM10025709]|uniref:DUF7544 domain-containing protein n=1 Tax=Halomicroarcula sp. GCM10025709 TaxID=3252669 RepID=UPI00360E6E1C